MNPAFFKSMPADSPATTILLFDIDDVLVKPLGYRTALRATVTYVAERMGFREIALPWADLIAWFEIRRITSEWDMIPLTLAILLDDLVARQPDLELPANLPQALVFLHSQGNRSFPENLDYRKPIDIIAAEIQPGQFPSETALRLSQPAADGDAGLDERRPPFPHLYGHPLLVDLLAETRSVERSLTTRLFQHYCLGSDTFAQTYARAPELETTSYLIQHDRPNLSPEMRQVLLERCTDHAIKAAAYTMRPSLPPREIAGPHPGYSPEAEMALKLVGLPELPLIAFGRVRWLAEQTGVHEEAYLKPSPVQATAALLAALSGDERASLESTLDAQRMHAFLSGFDQPLHVHVFEDSAGGIEAVRRAAQAISDAGVQTSVYAWGIAAHPQKAAALEHTAAQVFPDINDALRIVLATV
jgi:hypothetical protein